MIFIHFYRLKKRKMPEKFYWWFISVLLWFFILWFETFLRVNLSWFKINKIFLKSVIDTIIFNSKQTNREIQKWIEQFLALVSIDYWINLSQYFCFYLIILFKCVIKIPQTKSVQMSQEESSPPNVWKQFQNDYYLNQFKHHNNMLRHEFDSNAISNGNAFHSE